MSRLSVILICLIILLLSGTLAAQEDDLTVRVDFESVFVRGAPSETAPLAASVFQDNKLVAVGRNLDGTWFEVRRPNRMTNLGWIYSKMVKYTLKPEYLPLTDFVTGLEGPTPLMEDPGFAVFLLIGPALRSEPFGKGQRIINIPPLVTIPVLERDRIGQYLRVNYLGYEGWIDGFTTRDRDDILELPIAPGLPPLIASNAPIIPPEVQLAQVQRIRDFVTPKRHVAADLENFWWLVSQGEIVPCNPPSSISQYQYSASDVQALPELQRYAPRLGEGVDFLNDSISTLAQCGIMTREMVAAARADSINARIIFDAILTQLDDLEKNVIK